MHHQSGKLPKFDEKLCKEFEEYKEKNFKNIQDPRCNFADGIPVVESYKNILRFSVGNQSPLKIRVDCFLYHGAEKLVQQSVCGEAFFSNNVLVNKWVDFGNLRYCQLPMKTRLSINIVCVFREPGDELTIACVSMNLFDEKKRFRQGQQDLSLWPFYESDARLGCMKEYKGMAYHDEDDLLEDPTAKKRKRSLRDRRGTDAERREFEQTMHAHFSTIVLQFETFVAPLYYSSRDLNIIKSWKLCTNKDDEDDEKSMLAINKEQTNKQLTALKKCLDKNPIEHLSSKERKTLFQTREHYQTYPRGLPLFLRSV